MDNNRGFTDCHTCEDTPKTICGDCKHNHKCTIKHSYVTKCNNYVCFVELPKICGRGYTETERTMLLEAKVNECVDTVNDLTCKGNGVLQKMLNAAVKTGAYYAEDCVKIYEGYSPEGSAPYSITEINQGVEFGLRLASNNTTNSGFKEDAFVASQSLLADKLFSAIPLKMGGWFGKVRKDGAIVPSLDEPDLFTVGFTKGGTLKWYSNKVSDDQLRRDCLQNSMGCYGVVVVNGELSPLELRAKIPHSTVPQARIMLGQNYENKRTYVLQCGGHENSYGMRTETGANILAKYGCSIAVELASGDSAVSLDKGKMLFVPDDAKVPSLYAYWYISRKPCFTNDYQHEVGCLIQHYGRLLWEIKLIKDRVDILELKVDDLINRVDSLDDRMDIVEQRLDEIDLLIIDIQAELIRLDSEIKRVEQESKARDTALQLNIDVVEQESKDRDTTLQLNIDVVEQESKDRDELLQGQVDVINAEIDVIETTLNKEIQDRIEGDIYLQTQVDAINVEITNIKSDIVIIKNTHQTDHNTVLQLIAGLRDDVGALQSLFADLQAQVTALDNLIVDIQTSILEIKNTLITLEANYLLLINEITNIKNDIVTINKCYKTDIYSTSYTNNTGQVCPITVQLFRHGSSINVIAQVDGQGRNKENYSSDVVLPTFSTSKLLIPAEHGDGTFTLELSATPQHNSVASPGFSELTLLKLRFKHLDEDMHFIDGSLHKICLDKDVPSFPVTLTGSYPAKYDLKGNLIIHEVI